MAFILRRSLRDPQEGSRHAGASFLPGGLTVKYFAYGSNMSLARLGARTPSARRLGCYTLTAHSLRFHKVGRDGSGKCDALFTGNPRDTVSGVLFDIDAAEKWRLDEAEGLGKGYDEKLVTLTGATGEIVTAITYHATSLDVNLRPYSWYKHHVVVGARESGLAEAYIRWLESVESIDDLNRERDSMERAIYG